MDTLGSVTQPGVWTWECAESAEGATSVAPPPPEHTTSRRIDCTNKRYASGNAVPTREQRATVSRDSTHCTLDYHLHMMCHIVARLHCVLRRGRRVRFEVTVRTAVSKAATSTPCMLARVRRERRRAVHASGASQGARSGQPNQARAALNAGTLSTSCMGMRSTVIYMTTACLPEHHDSVCCATRAAITGMLTSGSGEDLCIKASVPCPGNVWVAAFLQMCWLPPM
jgi:hypothetical protein